MWDRRTFSDSSLLSQKSINYTHRSRGRLQKVRKSSASARKARILRPEASVYRWRDDAFNSVSRSAATHTISVDMTALDWCVADSEGTGTDGKDGKETSTGIDTVGDGKYGTENCTVGGKGSDTDC